MWGCRWLIGALLAGSGLAGPDMVRAGVDAAWRDHDRHIGARGWDDPISLRTESLAAAEAAGRAGDSAAEMRALADHLGQGLPLSPKDLTLATSLAARARQAGATATLFDLTYTLGQHAVLTHDAAAPDHVAALDKLAAQVGDPAMAAVVQQLRGLQAMYQGRAADAVRLLTVAFDATPNPFRQAEILLMRADAIVLGTPGSQAAQESARADLVKAIGLVDPQRYRTFGMQSLSLKGRLELSSGNPAAGIEDLKQALALAPASMQGSRENANLKMILANGLLDAERASEAAPLLDSLQELENFGPEERFTLAKNQARVAIALGGTKRLEQAGVWLERASAEMGKLGRAPRLVEAYNTTAARYYERTGQFPEAMAALRAAMVAIAQRQKQANERQRLEFQTQLDVAAKDRENALLRAQAQVESEQRLRWIWAFGASAVGALGIAAALGVSMRRKRQLARVSSELAQRNAQLEERSSSRIKLLAAACHDLRQPAHALGLLAELGVDAVRDPDTSRAWLQNIRRCSSTLTDMLGELMDLSRLDGGHYSPVFSTVALDEILHDVGLQYGETARQKGLRFEAPPCGLHVRSDRQLLRRIVFNLVSNAVKYTPSGEVAVSAEVVDGNVWLTVADTGPGIPPDRVQEVFQDYVRLEPLHAAEGLGIGLSIVRRAAELLEHRLELSSELGRGTRVMLRLGPAEGAAAEPGAVEARPERGDGMLVALLENDSSVRDAMAAVLQRQGYAVAPAASLEELCTRCEPGALHLLMTDLHLDHQDGLDMAAQVRAWTGRPTLPVVLVTGDLDAAVATRAASMGVFVAHKPLPPGRLLTLVSQVLALAREGVHAPSQTEMAAARQAQAAPTESRASP